jgi:hypothetical protein
MTLRRMARRAAEGRGGDVDTRREVASTHVGGGQRVVKVENNRHLGRMPRRGVGPIGTTQGKDRSQGWVEIVIHSAGHWCGTCSRQLLLLGAERSWALV